MSPNAEEWGSCGVSANEYSCAHWRSSSILNLFRAWFFKSTLHHGKDKIRTSVKWICKEIHHDFLETNTVDPKKIWMINVYTWPFSILKDNIFNIGITTGKTLLIWDVGGGEGEGWTTIHSIHKYNGENSLWFIALKNPSVSRREGFSFTLLWQKLSDGILKLLRSPGIDYASLCSPWRAGTTTLFLLGS